MTQSNTLARREEQPQVSLGMVVEMTGYSLPEVALIRHNMAASLRCRPEDVPFIDVAMFCKATRGLGLDPLVKQAHWISRGGRGGLQIGIDGFRAIADRAGNYAGSSEPVFRGLIEWEHRGKKLVVPEYCQITTWKIVQGHKCAFTGEARWVEYVPKVHGAGAESDMWAKMPRNQLAKCAEAQSLRKGWALQLGKVDFHTDETSPVDGDLPEVAAPSIRVEEQPTPRHQSKARRYDEIFVGNYGDDYTAAPLQPTSGPEPGPTEPEDAPELEREDQPADGAKVALLTRNSQLLAEAREAGIKGLAPFTCNTTWPDDKIEAANKELYSRVAARNGDASVAKPLGGQEP